MPPIIFLDVDGVLNHQAIFTPAVGIAPLCPKAVSRLLRLVDALNAQIVISSTWRLSAGRFDTVHRQKLRDAGILARAHKDWRTIQLPVEFKNGLIVDESATRGREIAEWLSRHPEHTEFAIIDDDSDMLPEQMPRFVKTTFETGLLDEHCDHIRAIFQATRAIA